MVSGSRARQMTARRVRRPGEDARLLQKLEPKMVRCHEPGTMSLPQLIAHYRITSKLGQGGMGEVWLARDTKLNRDVAIKVLPEAFRTAEDRMARFTREAQVLASLNHPNIAMIHGVEERAL